MTYEVEMLKVYDSDINRVEELTGNGPNSWYSLFRKNVSCIKEAFIKSTLVPVTILEEDLENGRIKIQEDLTDKILKVRYQVRSPGPTKTVTEKEAEIKDYLDSANIQVLHSVSHSKGSGCWNVLIVYEEYEY